MPMTRGGQAGGSASMNRAPILPLTSPSGMKYALVTRPRLWYNT
jgi:hypothetical protein